jgi:hypothetical protein
MSSSFLAVSHVVPFTGPAWYINMLSWLSSFLIVFGSSGLARRLIRVTSGLPATALILVLETTTRERQGYSLRYVHIVDDTVTNPLVGTRIVRTIAESHSN